MYAEFGTVFVDRLGTVLLGAIYGRRVCFVVSGHSRVIVFDAVCSVLKACVHPSDVLAIEYSICKWSHAGLNRGPHGYWPYALTD